MPVRPTPKDRLWSCAPCPRSSLEVDSPIVPHNVDLLSLGAWTLQPKSAILSSPLRPVWSVSYRRVGEGAWPTYEEVLRLDVSVNDMFLVQIQQCVCHLGDVLRCFSTLDEGMLKIADPAAPLLVKLPLLRQLFVQLSLSCKFQHKKDAFRVMEVAIQAQDIRMSGIHMSARNPWVQIEPILRGLLRHGRLSKCNEWEISHLRFCWISISRRTCFSTFPWMSSFLCRHLRATMKCGVAFVRAR